MDPQIGEFLTRWTIRLAVACYLARVGVDLSARRCGDEARQASRRWARRLWTVGWGLYVAHVICAFAFFHGWSHDAAYRHTAEETAAVVGIAWGGGLYINYAFTLFWTFDAIGWWLGDVNFPYRSRAYLWTLHAVFALMMFFATVVFGPPFWRPWHFLSLPRSTAEIFGLF